MYSLLTVLATKKWIIRSSCNIIYCIFVSWSLVVRLKMKNCTLYTQCVALVYSEYIAPTLIVKIENWNFMWQAFLTFMTCVLSKMSVCMLSLKGYTCVCCCMIPYKFKGAGLTISCILVPAWQYLVYWHFAWVNCATLSCHSIFYHDLAWLTIYGTTVKQPICRSGHQRITSCDASTSNWGECIGTSLIASDWEEWRLFEVRKGSSSVSTY